MPAVIAGVGTAAVEFAIWSVPSGATAVTLVTEAVAGRHTLAVVLARMVLAGLCYVAAVAAPAGRACTRPLQFRRVDTGWGHRSCVGSVAVGALPTGPAVTDMPVRHLLFAGSVLARVACTASAVRWHLARAVVLAHHVITSGAACTGGAAPSCVVRTVALEFARWLWHAHPAVLARIGGAAF